MDIYNNVCAAVKADLIRRLQQMDAGEVDPRWIQPWNLEPHPYPINWETRRYYSGTNLLLLDGCGSEFLTMQQIKALQGRKKYQHIRLRDGCQSCTAIYYGTSGARPIIRRYQLYSLDDIEGLELKRKGKTYEHIPTHMQSELEVVLHTYFRRESIAVRHTKSAGCHYTPQEHRIDIPEPRYFRRYSEYLSCLAHEAVHSTSERMYRKMEMDRDTNEYAEEELIAECGAGLLLALNGAADEETRHNNAAYLHGWLKQYDTPMERLDNAMGQAGIAVDNIVNP